MKEGAKVEIQTSQGTVELEFTNLQEAMERIGAANLEILRRWVQSLERICQEREESATKDKTFAPLRHGDTEKSKRSMGSF